MVSATDYNYNEQFKIDIDTVYAALYIIESFELGKYFSA